MERAAKPTKRLVAVSLFFVVDSQGGSNESRHKAEMGRLSTWLSRVGRTLHSMGKMEGTLGRRETDETGQRSRIGLGESLSHKRRLSKTIPT